MSSHWGSSLALLGDHTLWGWGLNHTGELGVDMLSVLTPTRVLSLTEVRDVSSYTFVSCAVLGDGSVQCFGGSDPRRGLGQFNTLEGPEPVPVPGVHNVRSVSVGESAVCAVDDMRRVWCWGKGPATTAPDEPGVLTGLAESPIPVSGIDDAVSVTVGAAQACALRANKQSACWGAMTDDVPWPEGEFRRFGAVTLPEMEDVVEVKTMDYWRAGAK